jgi:hypothetical protein
MSEKQRREGGASPSPGLSYHFKVEVEFSPTLAQKGIDPWVPHMELDVSYNPALLVSMAADGFPVYAGGTNVDAHKEMIRAALDMGVAELQLAMKAMLVEGQLSKELNGSR